MSITARRRGRDATGLTAPASLGVALALAALLRVLASITNVVGGTTKLALVVAGAVVCGVGLARLISPRVAVALAVVLGGLGLIGYYAAIPGSRLAVSSVPAVMLDLVALSTGLSVLRLVLVDVWVLVFAPVPTFLAAYLTARGRHVSGATAVGAALGFFVLTGDAGTASTLAGVIGVGLASGLSTVSVPGGLKSHSRTLAVILAVMILASATVTIVPAGATQPWAVDRGTPAIESTLVEDEDLEIAGTTRLSPAVRFTVESPVERNWHTGSYDTYTGDGWVRSGDSRRLSGTLAGPPGASTPVETSITIRTKRQTIPAPWKPVAVDGRLETTAQVDTEATIRPGSPLLEGDQITVRSSVTDPDPAALRAAGTDYPSGVVDRYTQLPERTPDRVRERTETVLAEADADTPYDKAATLEQYLRSEYAYSLSVARPTGDVADAFLFEMDAGYCVYFATTMAVMLRSQGVPVRLATGYDSGERVSATEYVVRGQDAHAWVMVYFPDHGWVSFDPTPPTDREQAEQVRLAEARSNGAANVDTPQTAEGRVSTAQAEPNRAESTQDTSNASDRASGSAGSSDGNGNGTGSGSIGVTPTERDRLSSLQPEATPTTDTGSDGPLPSIPSPETVVYWVFLAVTVTAGARHTGVAGRAYHGVRLRLPNRSRTPTADATRAFADLERLLARQYRPRRVGETPRAYLAALRDHGVDDRAHRVCETYERATYAGGVSAAEAHAARATVRRLAIESTPVLGRLIAT